MRYHDLSNQTFGRLTVLRTADKPPDVKSRDKYWLCRCECGNEIAIAARGLKTGHTQSCGCLQKERAAESARILHTTHGHSRPGHVTKEYYAWCSMKGRCHNPNDPGYPYYGGRGIIVCDRWLHSYETFLEDVGHAPTPHHSSDRVNPNGNYQPDNMHWATAEEQGENRRDRKPITFQGKTQLLSDWAEETGICIGTLWSRLYDYGWTIERALTTDPNLYHHKVD